MGGKRQPFLRIKCEIKNIQLMIEIENHLATLTLVFDSCRSHEWMLELGVEIWWETGMFETNDRIFFGVSHPQHLSKGCDIENITGIFSIAVKITKDKERLKNSTRLRGSKETEQLVLIRILDQKGKMYSLRQLAQFNAGV